MAAITLDHLSKGRVVLGLGVSGPQVVEGWYGQPFSKPLSRTREYVDIIKKILKREEPVSNDGDHYPLPYQGEGSWGLGKSLKSITHPLRRDLPIFLGAEGPKNVTMTAEIAEGWLPLYYSPYRQEVYADQIKDAKDGFEISAGVIVNICDDVEKGLIPVKSNLALYIGGMGAAKKNFHTDLMGRMGFEAEAKKIQELFLSGKRTEAILAVPDQFADEISLVGPKDRIKERVDAWRDTPVTSLLISTHDKERLREVAEIVL
jgi:F420-dependent oxidoreductase-like protein